MENEDPENNHPLVIEGDGGVGKKTLLVKWFEYHQSIKPKVSSLLFRIKEI
jgi:guanylate kinase